MARSFSLSCLFFISVLIQVTLNCYGVFPLGIRCNTAFSPHNFYDHTPIQTNQFSYAHQAHKKPTLMFSENIRDRQRTLEQQQIEAAWCKAQALNQEYAQAQQKQYTQQLLEQQKKAREKEQEAARIAQEKKEQQERFAFARNQTLSDITDVHDYIAKCKRILASDMPLPPTSASALHFSP